jgi:magnesium-transporting ATPase (P-type)
MLRCTRSNRHWEVVGDPTEGALLVVARKAGLDEGEPCRNCFHASTKSPLIQRASTWRPCTKSRAYALPISRELLNSCCRARRSMLDGNGLTVALRKEEIEVSARSMAAEGLRVLAVARLTAAGSTHVAGCHQR